MEYIAAALEARGHDVTLVDLRFGRPVEHYLKAASRARRHRGDARPRDGERARSRRPDPARVASAFRSSSADTPRRPIPRRSSARPSTRSSSTTASAPCRGWSTRSIAVVRGRRSPASRSAARTAHGCARRPTTTSFALDDVPCRRGVTSIAGGGNTPASRTVRRGSIETARGCPYRCSFCSIWQLHARSVRERSIGSVCEDFERVGDDVFVADDLFWYHPSRSLELAHALRKRGDPQVLGARAEPRRYRRAHPELLEAWRPIAREFDIFFGLEAASDDGLKGLVKDATVGQTEEAIAIARGLGYGVTGNFVIDPAWQEPDFERLWDFVDRHGLHQAGFTILTPLPGTAYFEEMRPRLGARKWAHFDMHHLLWEPALGAAAVLRALLRDVAPLRAQPGRAQERVAMAAAGPAAQRHVPAESVVAHAADDGPAALRRGIRSRAARRSPSPVRCRRSIC